MWCGISVSGSQWPLCHCRGALGVHPDPSSAPQVPRAAHNAVLWSWGPPGAVVSPPPCQGTAGPCPAAQPGGRTQLVLQRPLSPPWSGPSCPEGCKHGSCLPIPCSHLLSIPRGLLSLHCASLCLGSAFSLQLHSPCDLLMVIPSHGDRCALHLSKGQLHSSS